MANSILDKLKWLGHASFLIESEKIVYFDPWKIKKGSPRADLILISHNHYDHCSLEDVKKISKKETVIVTNRSCALSFPNIEVKIVKPGDRITINNVEIEVYPAYNINKFFHEKSSGGLGFVITLSGERIYHCGDTDLIPEMKDIKCDIALLAVSGTYVMTASEAAKACQRIKPKIAIPMHYGDIVGSIQDVQEFVKLCKEASIEAKILERS